MDNALSNYERGFLQGLRSRKVGLSKYNTWWAELANHDHLTTYPQLTSYEKIGDHAGTEDFWRGVYRSGTALVNYGTYPTQERDSREARTALLHHPEHGWRICRTALPRQILGSIKPDDCWSLKADCDSLSEGFIYDLLDADLVTCEGKRIELRHHHTHMQSWIEGHHRHGVTDSIAFEWTNERIFTRQAARACLLKTEVSDVDAIGGHRWRSRTWRVKNHVITFHKKLASDDLLHDLTTLQLCLYAYSVALQQGICPRFKTISVLEPRAQTNPNGLKIGPRRWLEDVSPLGNHTLPWLFNVSPMAIKQIAHMAQDVLQKKELTNESI